MTGPVINGYQLGTHTHVTMIET